MKIMVNPNDLSSGIRVGKGFTLFEIVIVLALAILISGLGIYHITSPETEKDLRTEHAKVEDFVLQARTFAVSYQQPFVVRFKEGQVEMEPQARPEIQGAGDEDEPLEEGERPGLRSLSSQSWPRVETFGEDYLVEISRWGSDKFTTITERNELVWVFDPEGLCEPLEVRISKDEGRNTITRFFNPLTGIAEDEEVNIASQ